MTRRKRSFCQQSRGGIRHQVILLWKSHSDSYIQIKYTHSYRYKAIWQRTKGVNSMWKVHVSLFLYFNCQWVITAVTSCSLVTPAAWKLWPLLLSPRCPSHTCTPPPPSPSSPGPLPDSAGAQSRFGFWTERSASRGPGGEGPLSRCPTRQTHLRTAQTESCTDRSTACCAPSPARIRLRSHAGRRRQRRRRLDVDLPPTISKTIHISSISVLLYKQSDNSIHLLTDFFVRHPFSRLSKFKSLPLTWVKGTAVHVCFMSFRLTGRDNLPPLSMALCHICSPCLFFRSISVGPLGCRWCRGLTGALEAGAGPGRPWDKKAGKGNLLRNEGAVLGLIPFLKSPDWARARGSSWTTRTTPRTGSSGPLPEDSNSTQELFKMFSNVLWGKVKARVVQLDKMTKVTREAIVWHAERCCSKTNRWLEK